MSEENTETVVTETVEATDSKSAISEAVKAAAASIDKGEVVEDDGELEIEVPISAEEGDSEEDETTQEEQEDGSEEEEDTEDSEESSEDEDARKVWAALKKDPKSVINWIAQQTGIKIQMEDNTTVTNKQKQNIAEVLTKHMGENYSFMAPQLGAAIEEILNERVDSKFQEQNIQKELDMVRVETERLMDTDKLSDKDKERVANEMGKRFKTMPPQIATMEGLKGYVNDIYTLSSNGIKKATKKIGEEKDRVKRQIQNRQDDEPSSVSGADFVTKKRPTNLTHRQAAEAALKGIVYAE